MTTASTQYKLDQLASRKYEAELLRLQYESSRKAIIPPETQKLLDDLDLDHENNMAILNASIEGLTTEIKEDILSGGISVKGASLQALYIKGASRWDMPELNRYAEDHLDLLRFKKEGEPSVSIRAVK